MAGGYDGTVRINTSLDASGMNKGTKDIAKSTSASLGGLMGTIKKLALTVGFLFTTEKIISFVRTAIQSFDVMGSSFGSKITQLSASFDMLKGALVNALLSALTALMPYIMVALDGFTKMLTTIAQVITILFGAAAAQDKLAGATTAAGKAAKGALASFDQLNVLQKPADTATAILPTVPAASSELIAQVAAFKAAFMDFIKPLQDAWGWLYTNILLPLGTWLSNNVAPVALDIIMQAMRILGSIVEAIKPSLQWLWDNFLKPLAEWTGGVIVDVLTYVRDRLKDLADWMEKNPDQVREFIKFLVDLAAAWLMVAGIYQTISIVGALVAAVQGAIATGTLSAAFAVGLMTLELLAIIVLLGILFYLLQSPAFKDAIEDWKIFFTGLGQHMQMVIDDFRKSFLDALKAIEDRFPIFGGIITAVLKGTINFIIDQLNLLLLGLVTALNLITRSSPMALIPGFSGVTEIPVPKIPRLATGAVIPPNAQFAAILGDQRNGTNIEAPADLIRSIVAEEIGKIEANISIGFAGDMASLVRELRPYIQKENVRIGGSLITSTGSAT